MSYYCESCQQTYGVGECLDRDKVKKLLKETKSLIQDWVGNDFGPYCIEEVWPELCENTEKVLKKIDKFIKEELK